MRTSLSHLLCVPLLAVTFFLMGTTVFAQNFQRQYGTAFDNAFTKVVRNGTSYYVVGRNQNAAGAQSRATVTYLNANGVIQWVRTLNTFSQWNDALLTANGSLLLVGNTLPADASNKSLAGLLTAAGTFSWLNSYDAPGREAFTRITLNPAPQNASFPYYILGFQYDNSSTQFTWDDVVLLNMSAAGNFNWKKLFNIDGLDDEFVRDLDALPNGDLILIGNQGTSTGGSALLVSTDNTGATIGGAITGELISYYDLHRRSNGEFYAVATAPGGTVELSKFDNNLVDVWHTRITGLSTITQVWEDAPNGWIYVVGTGVFAGKTRAIVVRLLDIGTEATQDWAKFLDKGEAAYSGGALWRLSGTQMAFVDGRQNTATGFGQLDAFLSVSDLELTTCMTVDDGVATTKVTHLFNGPVIDPPAFFDTPPATAETSTLITWQQADVCAPCDASFTFAPIGPCGNFQFTNTSTGSPLTYAWNFGDPMSGANNTSTAQNPTHQFSKCGTFKVCLKITSPDCMDSICQNVTYADLVKPTIMCPPNITIKCDQQLSPFFTGTATATDNCTPNIVATYTDMTTGLMPCEATVQRTWTATDACGNSSVCTQIIFVRDDVPPMLSCPQNLSVSTLPGLCYYTFVNLQQLGVTATDNCGIPTISCTWEDPNGTILPYTLQTQLPKGVNTFRCTAKDPCSNVSQMCSFPVTVKDTEMPTVTCPLSISVVGSINPQGLCKATVNGIAALVTDNCPNWTLAYTITGATTASGTNDASGTMFMQGASTVTYTVTDCGMNTKTCSFTVNVKCVPSVSKDCGKTVVTCYGFGNDPVAAIIDTRFNATAPAGNDWATVPDLHPPDWTAGSMGCVFGTALDGQSGEMYLAATDIYKYDATTHGYLNAPYTCPPASLGGGTGGVYKTNIANAATAGSASALVTTANSASLIAYNTGNSIPNTGGLGNGIGNLAFYTSGSGQRMLFLTNLEDGRIYRVNAATGALLSAFDPFGTDPGATGMAATATERLWGIGVYQNRVYFAREATSFTTPTTKQIWSIGLNPATGEFLSTPCGPAGLFCGGQVSAIASVPGLQEKITDIEFAADGRMLLAERGYVHGARVYEYEFQPGPGWVSTGVPHNVGVGNGGSNSAGGVDYGYRETGGNPTALCDDIVWASGNCLDAAAINANCDIYGIEGMAASGNVAGPNATTDLYIDYDHTYGQSTGPVKWQIGDVDVFKCGCPGESSLCDSIGVTSMPFNSNAQDTCCFKLTLNNQKPNYFTQIQLCAGPGVSFSTVSVLNGCTLPSFGASQITIAPAGGLGNFFGAGVKDFVKFCLSNYQTVPMQQVIVKYYGPNYTVVCYDTLTYECTQKPKCLKFTGKADCGPAGSGTYTMNFCIMSNALIGWNVASFTLNPPPGVTFTPSTFTGLNISPGGMQCNFTTTVSGPMATDGKQICFSITAHAANAMPPINCCTDTVMLACVTLPTCICNKVSATATPVPNSPNGKCCWQMNLTNNYSNTYFTEVQLCILTPGVIFGALGNGFPTWAQTSTPTMATFKKWPLGSFIGASATLPTFCLSGITGPPQVPQDVEIKWLDATGKVVCKDTLRFNCPWPDTTDCAVLVCPQVECDPKLPGVYTLTFQVKNNSAFQVDEVQLNAATGGALVPNSWYIIPPLSPGQTSAPLTAQIYFAPAGGQVCFYLSIHDLGPNNTELNCCTRSKPYCFTMPTCGGFCPGSLVQNGDFETGLPDGSDENIGLAANWSPIWPVAFSSSTGDFWNTLPPNNANGAFSVLTDPLPASQGNYGGFWCRYQPSNVVYREGIMNQLFIPIAPNTGQYALTLNVACLTVPFTSQGLPPLLSAYGTSGASTIPGTFPTVTSTAPTNPNLFSPVAVQLGTAYPIAANCDENFQPVTFTFNTAGWTAPIDRIFFTRDDAPGGGVYLAVDDVCLKPMPDDSCCTCGGTEELSFGGIGTNSLPTTCSGPVVEFPCTPANTMFWFHGNVLCNGDSCLQDSFIWNIKDPTGKLTASGTSPMSYILPGGNEGHFDITGLNSSLFAPGVVYTITVNWFCGNRICTCTVQFMFKECPGCKCGKFANMFLRPTQGAQSVAVDCGNTPPLVPCPPPGQFFNFSGQFMCQGNNCPATAPVDWVLLDPLNNPVASGTLSAAPNVSFALNFSPALFSKSGVYCLQLTGHCGSQLCPCVIKFRIEAPCPNDDCVCGVYTGMFLRSGQGPSAPVACGGSAVPVNCPPTGQNLVLTGQFQCQGNACPPTALMDWALYDPNNNGIGGGTGIVVNPNFTISVSPALLSLAGTYTLTLTTFCGTKECICDIKFIMDPPCPDKCECGQFTDLFWRPAQGAPSQSVKCGDVLTVGCNPQFNPVLSGQFDCIGNCPPTPPVVHWELKALPNGPVISSGNLNGPSFNLALLASYFNTAGMYELTLTSVCGGVVCTPCKFKINALGCPCECKSFDKLQLVNKHFTPMLIQPLTCGQSFALPCPQTGKPYKITGKLTCSPAPPCTASNIKWEIKKGAAVVAMGTQPGQWFNVTLSNTTFSMGNGQYTLTITGMCGTQTCTCTMTINVDGCPPPLNACPCTDIPGAVAQGFTVSWVGANGNGCEFGFSMNSPTTCTYDKLSFELLDPATNMVLYSVSNLAPNQLGTIIVPPGFLKNLNVRMCITRIIPGVDSCKSCIMQPFIFNCNPVGGVGLCINNAVGNGGFDKNSEPGILGSGGVTEGWTRRAGTPELLGGAGCSEPFSLKLKGKCWPIPIDIVDYPIGLSPLKPGFRVSVCYQLSAADAASLSRNPGAVLRLAKVPQDSMACKGECIKLGSIPLNTAADTQWHTASSIFLLDAAVLANINEYKYLTLHIENDLAYDDPDANSVVRIDNVCFAQNDSTKLTPTQEIIRFNRLLRIYPNPTPGLFTVELPQPATPGMAFRVTDLTGRLVLEKQAEAGSERQMVQADDLPSGLYFLQVVQEGRVLAVEKFVKQH